MTWPEPSSTNTTDVRPHPIPAVRPPAWVQDWRVWLLIMLVLLVPFLVPIPLGLRHHPIIGPLGDQLHTVLFCGATFMLYWKGPLTGRLLRAAVAAVASGGAIEILQALVGRTPLWHDFWLDLIGVGLAVSFVLWRGHRLRVGLLMLVALLVSIPVQLHQLPLVVAGQYEVRKKFPMIADFEGRYEHVLWRGLKEGVVTTVNESDGNTYLRLTGGPPQAWPGARMGLFPHDWTANAHLVLRARHQTPGLDTLRFCVRLDDFEGRRDNTWVGQCFKATTEWQTFEVQLADRRVDQDTRLLDLTDMDSIVIHLARPEQETILEFDDLWLR